MKNQRLTIKSIFLYCTVFAISLSPFTLINAQNNPKHFKNKDINCIYNIKNGMMDGNYQSFYLNGNKKSNGDFINNNKSGLWTIWDTTCNIIVERQYVNNFEYKQLFPLNPKNYTTSSERDTNGLLKYFFVKEEMVYASNRIWRIIPKENNPLLFDNDILSGLLISNILNGKIVAYNTISDEFTKPFSRLEVNLKYDYDNLEIVAYRLKEEWFFDNVRKTAEIRIMGICPVARYKNDTDNNFDLFWLYFPDIRDKLALGKIWEKNPLLQNIDDLFYFRYFSSSIVKESNIYNKEIKDYKTGKDIEIEAERIKLKLIEFEHDCWVNFATK